MPAPGALYTSRSITLPSSPTNFIVSVPLPGKHEVGGAVLVAEGVTADDDRLGPARHQPRHVLADDGLAEHDAAEDVADGAVRRLPHLLEAEFLHPGFVRGDGGAFDADAVLLDGFGGVDGDLVVGLVAVFHPEVVILRSISRNGLISLSLMYCQMIRVISSPSSSTTGLVTLIFAMADRAFSKNSAFRDGWGDGAVAIAPENAGWKANGRADPAGFQATPFRRVRNAVPASFASCPAAWRGSPRRRHRDPACA